MESKQKHSEALKHLWAMKKTDIIRGQLVYDNLLQAFQTCYLRVQRAGGVGLGQLISSDLSLQSSSPSQSQRRDMHCPLLQRNSSAVQF